MRPEPAPWTNQDLFLYHGTIKRHARSIVDVGIDLTQCRRKTDFGRGFYTTSRLTQAEDWANRMAEDWGEHSAIIEFQVQRTRLSQLSALWFVSGQLNAIDYWSLVYHYRTGTPHSRPHRENAWYDLVIGPVAADWRKFTVHLGTDQVSFHTSKAIALLDESPKRILADDYQVE